MQGSLSMRGEVRAKVMKAPKAPLSWKIRNMSRWGYIWGAVTNKAAKVFTNITGIPTITAELRGKLIKADGTIIDYGVLGRRLVTTAGVGFLVDDWDDNTTDITNMNYHASGTTGTAESNTDTALAAEATTVTDRATGTKTQPSANVLQSVGTQAFTGTAAIVEHGLFSVVTESTGVLWDRTVFSAINVANGDSIQFTYSCTVNAET